MYMHLICAKYQNLIICFFLLLFDLIHYVPVNFFSVMLGRVFIYLKQY